MNSFPASNGSSASAGTRYTLWQLMRYMLGLGTWGFGGPVALVGYMYRDLVERRQWISPSDYKEGMTLAQLMPGPLAAQLAIYLGYVHYRVLGATLAGVAFVLPSFLMVLALGAVYVAYGGIGWMQAVFSWGVVSPDRSARWGDLAALGSLSNRHCFGSSAKSANQRSAAARNRAQIWL